jgi:hypothetical protein
LPDSGSMRSGVLFPRPTWEPPISESEFSFWPSTRAEDAESCGNHPNGASDSLTGVTRLWMTPHGFSAGNGPDGNEFSTQVRKWPTPCANDDNKSPEAHLAMKATMPGGPRTQITSLQVLVQLWPTPQAYDSQGAKTPDQIAAMRERTGAGVSNLNEVSELWQTTSAADCKRAGNYGRGDGNPTLPEQAKRWPTAGANDHKGSATEGQRRGQLDEAAEQIFLLRVPAPTNGDPSWREGLSSRRRLNPGFAAWLMGMPWWWTNPVRISFAQSEMESWRCRLRSRLRFLVGGSSRDEKRVQL